jgi:hypothetical protein
MMAAFTKCLFALFRLSHFSYYNKLNAYQRKPGGTTSPFNGRLIKINHCYTANAFTNIFFTQHYYQVLTPYL